MEATCRPVLAKPHVRMLARDSSVSTTVEKRSEGQSCQKSCTLSFHRAQYHPVVDFNKGGITPVCNLDI